MDGIQKVAGAKPAGSIQWIVKWLRATAGLNPAGPYGAKGVGEIGLIGTAPAVANAICDAIGVRITDLPITPEKILRALRAKEPEAAQALL